MSCRCRPSPAPTPSTGASSSSCRGTGSRPETRSRQPDVENPLTGRVLPETKKDQFGASIGGPILKNKWFFFGDYQGSRNTVGGSRLLSVPTEAARRGDLSAYGVNIYDPLTGDPSARAQFPGNVIPGEPALAAGPEPSSA